MIRRKPFVRSVTLQSTTGTDVRESNNGWYSSYSVPKLTLQVSLRGFSGVSVSYRWEEAVDGGAYKAIQGATSDSLTITPSPDWRSRTVVVYVKPVDEGREYYDRISLNIVRDGRDGRDGADGTVLTFGAENLIKNGGFGAGTANWVNWRGGSVMAKKLLDSEVPKDTGVAFACEISKRTTEWGGVYYKWEFPLGRRYLLRFWARSVSGEGQSLRYGYEGDVQYATLGHKWVKYEQVFTANYAVYDLIFYCENAGIQVTAVGLYMQDDDRWRDFDYVREAIKGGTDTMGGLTLGNILAVRSQQGVSRAGLNGIDSSSANDVMLWAGATIDDMATAPFRVYEDGSLSLSNVDSGREVSVDKRELNELSVYNADFNAHKAVATMGTATSNDSSVKEVWRGMQVDQYTTTAEWGGKQVRGSVEFTLDRDATVWFENGRDLYAGAVPPEKVSEEGQYKSAVTLEARLIKVEGSSGSVVQEAEQVMTVHDEGQPYSKRSYGASLRISGELKKGKYKLFAFARMSDNGKPVYNYGIDSDRNASVQVLLPTVCWSYSLRRTALRSDGLVCIGSGDEYFYMKQHRKGNAPFLEVRGGVSLLNRAGDSGLVIDSNGVSVRGGVGVLASGTITTSRGHVDKGGSKVSSEPVGYNSTTGLITVPHKVGSTSYQLSVSALGDRVAVEIIEKTATSFSYRVRRNGTVVSREVDYIIIGVE